MTPSANAHPADTARRLEVLFGCGDLDAVFGPTGMALCPWTEAGRLRRGDDVLNSNTAAALEAPVWLSEVDPRLLWASQPKVLRHHVEYYRTGAWERTGVTSADRHVPANRFPVVAPDRLGRLVIRTGHHRSMAALIDGRSLLCRLATAPPDGATALTPTLLAGTSSRLPHTVVDDETTALDLIRTGRAVLCAPDLAMSVHRLIITEESN